MFMEDIQTRRILFMCKNQLATDTYWHTLLLYVHVLVLPVHTFFMPTLDYHKTSHSVVATQSVVSWDLGLVLKYSMTTRCLPCKTLTSMHRAVAIANILHAV